MGETLFTKQFTSDSFVIAKLTGKAFPDGDERFYEGISIDHEGDHIEISKMKDEDFIGEDELGGLQRMERKDLTEAEQVYTETLRKVKELTNVEDDDYLNFEDYRESEHAQEIHDIILDGYWQILNIIS